MWKYILFDLDGTLTDPKIGITKSVQYALAHYGIKVENIDDLCCFIGPPLKDSFCEFYGFDENKAEKAVAKYRERFATEGIYENEIFPGVKEMLEALKNSEKTVILATSKPAVYANKILEHFGIDKYFDFVSGSELDGTRSEKSEVINYALRECGIKNLSEAVMIGDRNRDILDRGFDWLWKPRGAEQSGSRGDCLQY